MCDTYVALGNATKSGNVIFGKNSDRRGNEAQLITYNPRGSYSSEEMLKCTNIEIPQVSETAAVILSQPFWMYGAEIGVNEHSVVIGNEAVSSKEPLKDTGLLGMDILRLGLERGKSAKEALNVMIDVLEEFGQGGAHNEKGLNYHNSYIVADPNEAYVFEAVGEWWIVENVKDVRSISNNISIRGKGDLRKEGIIQHAIEKGYCKDDDSFDFMLTFTDHELPDKFPPDTRDGCSLKQLNDNKGDITVEMIMAFLRTHEPAGICMHGRYSQSTCSLVSELKQGNEKSIHWFTGSTIPCLSIFKPYIFPVEGHHVLEPGPYDDINPEWFWSKHSKFVKPLRANPQLENQERSAYKEKIQPIEKDIISEVANVIKQEGDISEEEFVNKIKDINKEAWKKSLETLE